MPRKYKKRKPLSRVLAANRLSNARKAAEALGIESFDTENSLLALDKHIQKSGPTIIVPRPLQEVKSGPLPPLDYEIDGRPLYEQLPEEPSKAFEAFQIYRDLGHRRTYQEVARQVELRRAETVRKRVEDRFRAIGKRIPATLNRDNFLRINEEGQPLVSPSVRQKLMGWSKAYIWHQRAQAFDRHLDQERISATEHEVRSMVERHISISGTMQMKAFNRLKEMDKAELSPKMVLEYLLEGAKLERLSREMSTEQVKVSGDRHNPLEINSGGDLREELMRRIEQIASRRAKTLGAMRDGDEEEEEGQEGSTGLVQRAMREMGMKLLEAETDGSS